MGASRDEQGAKIFWSYDELSAATGIPVSALRRYVKEGKLPAMRFGNATKFDPVEAAKRLKSLGTKARPPKRRGRPRLSQTVTVEP